MFLENLRIALKALWANKMRSVLTTLGVIIGVASVIAVVSLVQGMQHNLTKELEGVGATYLRVQPDPGEDRLRGFGTQLPELTYEDGRAVLEQSSEIVEFTPILLENVEMKFRDQRHSAVLLGVSESYQEVVNHWVDRGRFFTPVDMRGKKRVCTIGTRIPSRLGIEGSPLGRTIQISGQPFTIVGVMEKKGSSFGFDQDDIVLVPFPTASVLYGGSYRTKRLLLDFQARNAKRMDLAREQIRDILRRRHGLKEGEGDDFRIVLQEEIIKTVGKVLTNTSLVMAAVVGIALLVGGIGIMNIMLVSVTERTREIGIRKSMGARRQDVLLQFLIEAITLSGAGGLVGIAVGMALANGVRLGLRKLIDLPAVHTPLWAIALSFGFCAILGVIFGIYPAAKASKLDPIDALRYE
jgi:putative ABC transport system permease protein